MSNQQFDGRPGPGPYGQPTPGQPYGAPGTQAQYPQPHGQPYGGAPTQYPPYGQPSGPPYGQPAPYGTAPVQVPERSALLGVVGFGVVLVSMVVLLATAWIVGRAYGQFLVDAGVSMADVEHLERFDEQMLMNMPGFQQFIQTSGVAVTVLWIAVVAGLVGWIISIVATATRRGRAYGIFGIVVGVIAPIAGFFALIAGLWPFFEQLTHS